MGVRFLYLLMALLCARQTNAQDARIDAALHQLEEVHSVTDVSISPDGRWASWSEHNPEGAGSTMLFIQDLKDPGAKPRRVSVPEGNESMEAHDLSWSPDSREAVFLANANSSQDQVYVTSTESGEARKLTTLSGFVLAPRWSPNGKEIAFLYSEKGSGGGPLQAAPAQLGEIGATIRNQRLTMVPAEGGDLHQLTRPDLNLYEYDWAPDGEHFVATAAPGPADNNWWTAKLYSVAKANGEMNVLYNPSAQIQLAVPRWSPDGKQIAFIGGLMSDEGFTGGNIFVIPASGGLARNLTADQRISPSSIQWHGGDRILFTAGVRGGGEIASLDLRSGQIEPLWKGDEGLHEDGHNPNFAVASDGRTSVVSRSSWQDPPEIWAGPLGAWKQLTTVNASQKPRWGKAESVVWQSRGNTAQGWLLYPDNFDSSKRYPMVVEIHGGPASLHTAAWPSSHFDMSVMAGLGYFVFFPNPRGSYGEGEAFTKANVKDFGGGDLRDVLAGVDTVLKKAPVDKDRIGVTGWSYGGYMTMWTVTQTNRFRAAVAGAGIANWLSYYGENLIDQWMIPYFGASVYDNPAVYAKSSPITYIKQVKTPTLVVVGERDAECPAPQSFEFWHALKTLNVPTKLVVYAGEGHGFREPKDRLDVVRRTVSWFDEYLKKSGESAVSRAN